LPSGAFTYLATQTNLNNSSSQIWLHDCSAGDTHGLFAFVNSLGAMTSDTGIYYTGGAAVQSWKIVGAAAATVLNPFVTPWIDKDNTDVSTSITPRLEILRDGNSTKYTSAQVWGEFSAKTTSGSVLTTLYTDRQALSAIVAGTAASDQAAGTDTWDGENATHSSMKIDSGSAFTPSEVGHIRGRVCVAGAITVYVDPQIRT